MVLPQKKTRNGPTNVCQLIFDNTGKNIQWKKDSLFSKWCWEKWKVTCKRTNLDHYLTPYTKINWKWMKNINVRQETIQILNETRQQPLWPRPQQLLTTHVSGGKTKMNYWDFITKLKTLCTVKETTKTKTKLKDNWQNRRRYLQMTSDKRLVSKIYKALTKLNT